MIRHRILARWDARRAIDGLIALKEYMEGKLRVFMRKAPVSNNPRYSINISEDGSPIIIEESLYAGEEADNEFSTDYEEINIALANLDRRITLGEENLQERRDELHVAEGEAEPPAPLLRDKLLALISFLFLSIGEVVALSYFLGDFFSVDVSGLGKEINRNPVGVLFLIPLAACVFTLLLVTATKVVTTWRERDLSKCSLFLGILIVVGGFLGTMRGLQAARGEVDWGLLFVSIAITTGVPIALAVIKIRWYESAVKLDKTQAVVRRLRNEIRELEAHIRGLRRLRRRAQERRARTERNMEAVDRISTRRRDRQLRRELRFLRKVAAWLNIYKEQYQWWSARKSRKGVQP